MKKFFLYIALIGITAGCSKDSQLSKNNMTHERDTHSQSSFISSWNPLTEEQVSPTIQVVDQFNQPIPNAKVLVGQATDIPFKNNLFITDKTGFIRQLGAWKTQEHVTAEASGYIRQTLLSQFPGKLTLRLNTAYLSQKAIIKGQVTQLPTVDKDKFIDFGLVMKSLTKSDLLNFDLNSVISPVSDIMKVATYSIPVPTNVSLPKQKESYIIGVTIEKPEYRFMVPTLGTRRLFAATGKFPFKPVVDQLNGGKPFYEIINYFDLQGGGFRDVTVTGQTTLQDIPGNELTFTAPISITSPQINADEVFISLSASEVSGYMVPTGIKKLGGNEKAQLKSLADKPAFIVNVLKKQSEFMSPQPGADRLSASILPYKMDEKTVMLPLINNPSVTQTNGYRISIPSAAASIHGIYPLAFSAVISDLQITGPSDKPVTELTRQWEILGINWAPEVILPHWPLTTAGKKRFEINLIGGLRNQQVNLGDELIQAATHVTHSSTDF